VGEPLQRLRRSATAVALCAALAGAGTQAPTPISAIAGLAWFRPAGPSTSDPWAHLFLPPEARRPGLPIVVTPAIAGSGSQTGAQGGALGWTGIPATVLEAYRAAAAAIGREQPNCNLTWTLLAAIGRIESGHARAGDVDASGTTRTPIVGPQLDGSGSFALIGDSDGGGVDGDPSYDRAVGPMQFLPGTWRSFGRDGNGDGRRDPHNVFDAALGAATYLCSGGRDLSDPAQLRAAIFAYNHSDSYVRTVLAWAQIYATGVAAYDPPLPSVTPVRAGAGPVVVAAPPGQQPSPSPTGTGGTGGGTASPGSGSASPAAPGQPPEAAYDGSIVGQVVDDVGNPIAGVKVTLSGAADKTTSTGADGAFSFGALAAGTYHLTKGAAVGYADKSPNEIRDVKLAAGQQLTGLKFVEQSASLMGMVFVDNDDDGMPTDGDHGIPHVQIELEGLNVSGGEVKRSVVTDENGVFAFTGLPAGIYDVIQPFQPEDYDDGKETAPSGDTSYNDEIRGLELAAGSMIGGLHFGERPIDSGGTDPASPEPSGGTPDGGSTPGGTGSTTSAPTGNGGNGSVGTQSPPAPETPSPPGEEETDSTPTP
jgi:hypothetical protein